MQTVQTTQTTNEVDLDASIKMTNTKTVPEKQGRVSTALPSHSLTHPVQLRVRVFVPSPHSELEHDTLQLDHSDHVFTEPVTLTDDKQNTSIIPALQLMVLLLKPPHAP